MLIRQSSDASEAPKSVAGTRKDSNRHKRYLCALFEKDIESQGTIEARRRVCIACRNAWDQNIRTFIPIFKSIQAPLPWSERLRGDIVQPPLRPPNEESGERNNELYTQTANELSASIGAKHAVITSPTV